MTLLRFCARGFRSACVVAACAVTALAHVVIAPSASATHTEDRLSARATPCELDGEALRYVVLFDKGTSSKRSKAEIRKACGQQTIYYPSIAVGVAKSADPSFDERIGQARAFSAQREREAGVVRTSGPSRARTKPKLPTTDPNEVPGADRTDEQWNMRAINADLAREINPGDRDVVVGVLDSGIDAKHPELADVVDPELSAGCLSGKPDTDEDAWSPTYSAHGTHVAGTIAAADDGAGITGVAPGVRLASIRVIGDRGYVDPEAVVCGLMWAAEHEMKVTNSSYFVDPSSLSCAARADLGVVREAIERASEHAMSAGTLNVAAVTNDAVNLSPARGHGAGSARRTGCEALPASLRSVVAVSSVGPDRVKAGYSSYGLGVIDLAAPGGEERRCVLSTVPNGYSRMCGASMAAPHVAGVAALAASEDPDAGPEELRRAVSNGARQMACPTDYDLAGDGAQDAYCAGYRGYNSFYGHGMADALTAVTPSGLNLGR